MKNEGSQSGMSMESLKGKFLVATPQMPDPRFSEQIIYLCSHSAEGAMGFVVNQPSPFTLADIYQSANIKAPEGKLPSVYIGGPVEMTAAYFIFSSDYKPHNYIDVSDAIRVSGDSEILFDLSKGEGPKDYIFLLGYAGWGAGQLESELTMNGWLILPAEYDDIFRTPDEEKWKKVAARHGIDISLLGDIIGNA